VNFSFSVMMLYKMSMSLCWVQKPAKQQPHRLTATQVRNDLGTPEGEEFSERGPNFLNCVQ